MFSQGEIPTARFYKYLLKQEKEIREGKQPSIYFDNGKYKVDQLNIPIEYYEELLRNYADINFP